MVTEIGPGKKFDNGKDDWSLVPVEELNGIVKVLTYGKNKYGSWNWEGVESDRYYSALLRHIFAWRSGEKNDKESQLHHLAHAMVNCIFLMYKEKSGE